MARDRYICSLYMYNGGGYIYDASSAPRAPLSSLVPELGLGLAGGARPARRRRGAAATSMEAAVMAEEGEPPEQLGKWSPNQV